MRLGWRFKRVAPEVGGETFSQIANPSTQRLGGEDSRIALMPGVDDDDFRLMTFCAL